MKWNRFTIKTKTDAEDMIICTLAEIGVEGAEIQDHQPLTEEDKAQMFVDIMPEGPEDDGVAYLNFYLEEDADKDVILRDVRNALEELRTFMDIGEGTIEESQTEDKDWINNWKEFFHQFYVDDILIVPSWEEIKEEDKDKMILHIDPGTAFGTGMHETTQLVIRQLKKYVKPGIELLDVGTGSGAIAITLALEEPRLKVIATDISKEALVVAQDNAKTLGANVEFRNGDMLQPLLDTHEKVDIFVSNPPYIPNDQDIEAMVKDNEPHVALFGGNDGLYFYRKIFKEVKPLLNDRALLAFEMGFDQRELMETAIKEFFGDYPFEIIKDINGKDRMLFIYYNLK